MSFDTYANLQSEILDWIDRASQATVVAKIPSFITIAEAQIARDLRRYTKRASVTLNADQNNLPSDVRELESARLVTTSAIQDLPLIVTTPEELAVRRAQTGDAPGRPLRVAILNDGVNQSLLTQPTPDGIYSAEITYFQKLVPLSASNTSNIVLVEAPDLYLFGALKEAEAFLENDERVAMWEAKYGSAFTSMMAQRDRESYQASRRPQPLERVFE